MPQPQLLPKLLIATTNVGKVAEIRTCLTDLPYEVIGLNDLDTIPPVVEETGDSFAANAMLKAGYYFEQTGLLTLSDDSGLMVDALDGRPGVYSARYAGEGATSEQLVAKLLEEMKGVDDAQRQAQFVCGMALRSAKIQETFAGLCAGRIAHAARGQQGFGFDPVFIDPASGRTFAELSRTEKNALSHRGKALAQVRHYLEAILSWAGT